MPKQSQDVDAAGNGTVTTPSPFQRLRHRMAEMAIMETASGRSAGEDINPILTAQTEEEMWEADELDSYNAQKLSGCDLQTTYFEVRFGDGNTEIDNPIFVDEKGRQMYLLVHSFRITKERGEDKTVNLPEVGEEFVWNTSARNIVGKLFWMLDAGWFDPDTKTPARFRIKGTKLTGGRSVEKLKAFTGTPLVTAPVMASEELPF
jgi:hypothetical protein